MPIIEVSMLEGRTAAQKDALAAALTQAAHTSIGAPIDTIKVLIREIPLGAWFNGGVSIEARRKGNPAGG